MTLDKARWRIFGDWLKSEREAKNYSQDGLGDLVGVDRQTIYRLENALSGTKRETIIALAKALRVNESEALKKAGFAPQNESEDTYQISFGIEVTFRNPNFSEDEKKNLMDSLELTAAGLTLKRDQDAMTLEEAIADNEKKKKARRK